MENDPSNMISPALLMLERFLDEHVEDMDETIVLTHVTSPFLKSETILKAVEILEKNDYEYVHAVSKKNDFDLAVYMATRLEQRIMIGADYLRYLIKTNPQFKRALILRHLV